MLRDETEHTTNQQGARGYSAELGARGSAFDGRTGAVLAQVVGEGDAELQRPAALPAASTGLIFHGSGSLKENQGGVTGCPPLCMCHTGTPTHQLWSIV